MLEYISKYISGDEKMRSVLKNATKGSSILRKAIAPRKPRRDPSLSSSPRSRSRSRPRSRSPSPTPPRRPQYPSKWSRRSTGSSRGNSKRSHRGSGSSGSKKPRFTKKKHWFCWSRTCSSYSKVNKREFLIYWNYSMLLFQDYYWISAIVWKTFLTCFIYGSLQDGMVDSCYWSVS